MSDDLKQYLADGRKARAVIEEFLVELVPGLPGKDLEHNSRALVARLAHANLFIESLKED